MNDETKSIPYQLSYWPLVSDVAARLLLLYGWQADFLNDTTFWIAQLIILPLILLGTVFYQGGSLDDKFYDYDTHFDSGLMPAILCMLAVFGASYLSYSFYPEATQWLRGGLAGGVLLGYGLYMIALWAGSHLKPDIDDKLQRELSIKNTTLKNHLERGFDYQNKIEAILAKSEHPTQAKQVIPHISEALEIIQNLTEQVDHYQQDKLIQEDLAEVPENIKLLEAQIAEEDHPETQEKLQQTLEKRVKQLDSLIHLNEIMEQAEISVEQAVSNLGTIYSQLLIEQSSHKAADYGKISEEIDEQVHQLQDQLEALQEVKLARS